MASLGLFQSPEPLSPIPETVNEKEKKTGEAMVNKPSESSSPPPIVVQPGRSNGGHGNRSAHGNSEAANSQMDTVVFSFRNYILGTDNSAKTAEMESKIKTTQSQEKRPEIKPEKEKDEQTHSEMAMNTDSFKETPKDAVFSEQRENIKEANADSNAVSQEKGTPDGSAVITEKNTEAITEVADIKKENQSNESSINTHMVESRNEDESDNETSECSSLHFRGKDTIIEMQSEADSHQEEDQESKTDKQTNSPSDLQADASKDKKAKKKEKKKQRKKKKMEKSAETELKAETTAAQPENYLQAVPLINAGNNTDSKANTESVSEADTETVVCGEQPDNGFYYKQQLSLGGKRSSSPPLSSSHMQQDHLTDLACSPVSSHTLSQESHQSDNHKHTDAPCGMNHSSESSPQSKQHATGDVINNQNTTLTYVETAVINSAASADKRSDAQAQEAIVTSEAEIHTLESWSPLSNSRTCVGESSMESALEEALVVVAALPLTTPTMPEVIESEGEGESMRRDSLERATVAIAESEKAAGEKDLGEKEKCLGTADGERGGLMDSLPQLSLVFSQEKCSLAFSAKEGQATSEKSCSSKMPHNTADSETKGPRESTVRSADTEIFPAEEGDREKERVQLETYFNTSPLGLLTGPDCLDQSAAGLEGAGEGGGRGEEVEEKGGLAREHGSFSQPEGFASGVSSAETETCPPTDVAESQLKSQSWGEPIATITESICTEQDRLSHPCQEQLGAAISPLPTHPKQSCCNTDGGADIKLNLISEEELSSGPTCGESFITLTGRNYSQVFLPSISPQPLTTSQQIPVEQQESNNQQVQPESSTTEVRTAEIAAEAQAQTQSNSSLDMSGVGMYVYNDSGGKNRVHFADTVKQESSSSVDVRNMSMPSDCASLPPLTVHESLHYPVVEASFIFKDFLGFHKAVIPTEAAPTKNEPAIQHSTDFQKTQKDVQLDKKDTATQETTNITRDQSVKDNLETDTVNLQAVTEASSKPLQSSTEKNQTGNEERFDLLQTTKCDDRAISDHLTVEQVSAKVPEQEEVEIEKGAVKLSLSKEKEPDDLHVECKDSIKNDQPQESPIISDVENVIANEKEGNQHPPVPCSVLPPDDVTCKPLSDTSIERPDGQLSTDIDSGSLLETVTLTCSASLETKPTDPSCLPPAQVDQSPPCAVTTTAPMNSSKELSVIQSAELTKDESVTSGVTAADQSISVSEQCASNSAFAMQLPGPMLNHLEFVNDCGVSPPEQKESCSADGDNTFLSREVDSNEKGEITQKSLAEDLEHSDVNVKADKPHPEVEDSNDPAESFVALDNSSINNEKFPSDHKTTLSQEESLSPKSDPLGAVGAAANGGSDNVISHTDPNSICIKPVICKVSTRDDLMNASFPFSSDLPTNEALDESKQDNMKDEHKLGDQTSVPFKEEKKELEQPTMDNQKETTDGNKLQTGKTGTAPQQSNGPDKEAVEEIEDLQRSHKHKVQETESPIRDLKEEGDRQSVIASKSETETSSLSSDRPAGSSEDMLCAEVESGSESQTVYGHSLRQTLTVTQEHTSDRDTAPHDLSADPGQSQSTQDPNSFAQQQEQQQPRQESRQPTEELSGGCLEGHKGGEKTNSQISQTQALVPGVNEVAEGGDDSVGSLRQSGSRDELTGDDSSGNNQGISVEKGKEEGAQTVPGVDRIYVPSPLACDLNQSGRVAERNALADIGIVTARTHVGETTQEMDGNKSPGLEVDGSGTDLMPDPEFLSDLGVKGQQKSNLLAACQDQHEALKNTVLSVERASQEHETSSLGLSVSPKVSKDSHDIHTDVVPSADQAEEIHTKIFSSLPDPVGQPETVEKYFNATPAVKSKSSETEECEIQDTVCKLPELESSNKTPATQSSPAVQTPIKGPDVVEITKGDKAALDEENASSQGKGQSEIKVINNEATEKQVINLSGSANDSGSESVQVSDISECEVSHSSTDTTDTTVCHSEGSIAPGKTTEDDNDTTDKIKPHVLTVPPAVLSKSPEDVASTPLAAPSQSEKPHDQLSLSQPPDDIVVTPIVIAGQCEPQEKNAHISSVEQVSMKAETAQKPDTNWIRALRDAAAHSQTECESTVATSR